MDLMIEHALEWLEARKPLAEWLRVNGYTGREAEEMGDKIMKAKEGIKLSPAAPIYPPLSDDD